MRRFFELCDELDITDRWHLGDVLDVSGDEPILDGGVEFQGSTPLTVKVHSGEVPLEFCLTSFAVPVATEPLADRLGALVGQDVQCLKATIGGGKTGSILNVLSVVECVNEEASEFLKWTEDDHRSDLAGQYRMMTDLQIDAARVPENVRMFRLKGWLIGLIVDAEVKAAMELVGCQGAKFLPVS